MSLLLAVFLLSIPAPDDWRKEEFRFPLPFAPSIPYEGVEVVRFAPAWSRFAAPDGFTYVFAWEIKARPMEPQHLERALGVYFDGLMENVARGRKLDGELGVATAVALHPLLRVEGWDATYAGRIWTLNAFSMNEPLVLNTEISLRPCGADRMQLFFAVSKAERHQPAWAPMRELRKGTACTGG